MTLRRPLRRCLVTAACFGFGLIVDPSSSARPSAAWGQPTSDTTDTPPPWRVDSLQALASWVAQRGGSLSAHVHDLESGRQTGVYQRTALNPASNMKVVTAVLALDKRGADYSYRTALHARISAKGECDSMVLHGDGDPWLQEADLWRLAAAAAARGVRRVKTLLVDQSAFDEQFIPPAFEQQPDEWAAFRAPVSAIAVERNTVTLNVLPRAAGEPARAWFEPDGAVAIEGSVATLPQGKGQQVRLNLSQLPGAGLQAQLGGHVATGLGRQRFSKRVEDPRLIPGLVLRAALEQRGVKVDSVALGSKGGLPRLTYIASPPLEQLLADVGKRSDNFTAEMVFKSLSSRISGPATAKASADLAMQWLRGIAPTSEQTQIRNGSGLFDANRLSAETLVAVLRYAYQSPTLRYPVMSQLAVGGVDGTLRGRFTKLSGQVRAKTGTLNEAITLSGYVLRGGTQAPIVFSLLVNGVSGRHAEIRQRIDTVVGELHASPP